MGIAAGLAAVSAVSTAAQISSQNKALKSQQEGISENQRALTKQTLSQYNQNLMAQQTIREQTASHLSNLERAGKVSGSKVAAAQAATGFGGQSQVRQRANVFMQEAIQEGSIIQETENVLSQKGYENIATSLGAQSNYNQMQSQINQLQSQKTTGLSSILSIGTSAMSGYITGSKL